MVLLAFVLTATLSAQEERRSVDEVVREEGAALKSMEGVVEVSAGEPRVLLRVSSKSPTSSPRRGRPPSTKRRPARGTSSRG